VALFGEGLEEPGINGIKGSREALQSISPEPSSPLDKPSNAKCRIPM
jgi:hypothetical protein